VQGGPLILDKNNKFKKIRDPTFNKAIGVFLYAWMDVELQKRIGTIGTVTANAVFKALALRFKPSTHKDITRLKGQLLKIEPEPKERALTYLYRFNDVMRELAAHDVLVSEHTQFEDFMLQLEQHYKSEEMKFLIARFRSKSKDSGDNGLFEPPTLADLEKELNELERDRRADILAARSHQKKPPRSFQANAVESSPNRQLKCFKCGKAHSIKECPTASHHEKSLPFSHWQQQRSGQSEKSNVSVKGKSNKNTTN
jgi:hypothetical protein